MPPADPPLRTLLTIARRCGTPAYAYDLERIRSQVAALRANLPPAVEILYSLKANPSLGLCGLLARAGLGADVASPGELVTALEAGFPVQRIFVSGPHKSPETLEILSTRPGSLLSIDSPDELSRLARGPQRHRALLRLRPDFDSAAAVPVGPDSRFGIRFADLPRCRADLTGPGIEIVGFHVFCGSQVMETASIVRHLRGATRLALRAGDALSIVPEVLNLGGGFGIPYRCDEPEVELAPVGEELQSLVQEVSPARILIELGRYLVAQAGWYLTTVVGRQSYADREAVVVDGGTHQRADLCGLDLRRSAFSPLVLDARGGPVAPTSVLGCLSAPLDVLAEASLLPSLLPGDVLAFPNAGAYGLSASPTFFHCQPPPAEVAFEGTHIEILRPRQPARSLLESQCPLEPSGDPATAAAG